MTREKIMMNLSKWYGDGYLLASHDEVIENLKKEDDIIGLICLMSSDY